MGGLYGLLALSVALVRRTTGAMSFAHGELGGVGTLVVWWVLDATDVPWMLAAAAGVIAAAAIGALFDVTVARRVGDAQGTLAITVATIALLTLLLAVELKWWGAYPRVLEFPLTGRIEVLGVPVSPAQVIALAAGIVASLGVTALLRRTPVGLAMIAMAADRTEAALLGLPVKVLGTAAWAMTAALAAVAALLFAPVVGAVGPGTMTFFFVRSLAGVALGGSRTMVGPFLGGIVVGIVEQTVLHALIDSGVPSPDVLAVFVLLVVAFAARRSFDVRAA